MLVQHVHQLRERGRHIDPFLVLRALQALVEDLFDDSDGLFHILFFLVDVQEQGHERRLSICSHQGIDLVLDGLHAGAQLILQAQLHDFLLCRLLQGAAEFLVQLGAELHPALVQVFPQVLDVHGLPAVLVAGHRRDDLGGDGAGHLEALGGFDHFSVDGCTIVQHVLDVDQAAVEDRLDEIVRVMEVEHALIVGLGDVLGQEDAPGQIPAHLTGDIVPLGGGQAGVLVGILLCQLLVLVADELQDGLVRGVGLAQQAPLVTVHHIFLGEDVFIVPHQVLLNHVLHMLHGLQFPALSLHGLQYLLHQSLVCPVLLLHLVVGFLDGRYDFLLFIGHYPPVSFLNPHVTLRSWSTYRKPHRGF